MGGSMKTYSKQIDSKTKKGLRNPKKNQSEKKAISKIKNTQEGMNSRLDEIEDQISELEDKVEKNT